MADLEAVNDLIRRHEVADESKAESELDDLRGAWERARFDLSADAWLVESEPGAPAAYGEVWPREGYTVIMTDGYVHPEHRGRGLGGWVVRQMESRARDIAAEAADGERVVLQNIVSQGVREACELLESEGYRPERYFWRMVIDMDGSPDGAEFPEGVTVRTFRPDDAEAVHELITTAFADNAGHQYSPFEEWRAEMMERESFNPRLWFVADADGQIVAAALCPDYPGTGWVRQFAVRREYRGRGIGQALLRHVFRKQFEHGNRTVGLVVDSYNRTGAKQVYERAGMQQERTHVAYQKELIRGTEQRA